MKKDPMQRATIEQILDHEFLIGAEDMREAWTRDYASYM